MPNELTAKDHFSKASVLHSYVQKDLGEAKKHAIETGKELIAAKEATPHGRWEDECKEQFAASLRTAQFYMQFTNDMGSITKAQSSAVLMLEGTLDGAAKAARKAAHPEAKPPKKKPKQGPEPDPFLNDESDLADAPEEGDVTGKDGPKEGEPTESGQETPSRPPRNGKDKPAGPKRKYDRPAYLKQWDSIIGPLLRLVDAIAEGVGERDCQHHEAIQAVLNAATEEMTEWMEEK